MSIEDYVKKQIKDHKIYVNKFQPYPSNTNEQFYAGTQKVMSYSESYFLIEKDLEKRVKNIIKKLER